ncbi:MAG: hypothetical protein IKJ31_08095 [Bacteroidaceae bacterium]|nr:hypothetical protein [Bacteroidaceae bacterium]
MNAQFSISKKHLEDVVNLVNDNKVFVEAILNEKDSEISIDALCQEQLMSKFTVPQIEAEEIVNGLKNGCSKFYFQFNKNKEAENIHIKECLKEVTKDYTDEERKEIYLKTLREILRTNGSNEEVINTLSNLSAEELLDEIEKNISETIDKSLSLGELAKSVKDELTSEILSSLAKEIENKKNEYSLVVALLLYINQREGKLNLLSNDSNFPLSTEELGMLAAASIETIIVNKDLQENKINMTKWQEIMKWILAALIGLALLALACTVTGFVGFGIYSVVLAIFGTCTTTILIGMFAGYYVASKVSSDVAESVYSIFEMFLDFYDAHIIPLINKIGVYYKKMKEWASEHIVDNVENMVTKQTIESSEQIQTVTVDTDEDCDVETAKVMA